MRKIISVALCLIILSVFAINVNAEVFNGGDAFTVDIPEGFEQSTTSNADYSFSDKDGNSFVVTYTDNTNEDEIFCVENLSKSDIEEYTTLLSEQAEAVMQDFADEFKLEFLSSEKIKHSSGKKALVCKTKTSITKGDKSAVYYQTMYEFGGANYKYTFTYTTEDKDKQDSFNAVFDSIEIAEGEAESWIDALFTYSIAGLIALVFIVGIIRFIRTPEKRKQGKL